MRTILIGLACVAVGVAADALFLPHQTLWNDEATQMAGLALDPVELTRWLADRVDYDFGVPDDRMPPLSYWAGWAWSRATGLNEATMRWMGVVGVAIATAVVFAAASRAWGTTAGAAAAMLLATSPNVVVMSVEIRAYPLLILASAGVYACLIGYATSPPASRRRWLAGMVAAGVAAMYTHFFGLVAVGGALVAALFLARAEGMSVRPVLVAGAVAAVAALGLAPFVGASTDISPTEAVPAERKLVGLARLAYRQFAHPAMSLSPAAVGMAGLGLVLGVIGGLAPKARSPRVATGLGLALAAGGAVAAMAHLAQSAFEAARPSYNAWMLPPLAMLVGAGLAARSRVVRGSAAVAIVLLLAANLYADAQLALRGEYFAHGPHRPIAELIRRLGPRDVAVIHDEGLAWAWGVYAPIRYEFGGEVRQYAAVPAGPGTDRVRVTDYPSRASEYDPIALPFRHLIVVRSELRGAQEIVSQIRRGIDPLGDGPATRALLASGAWERVEARTVLSFAEADLDVFRRAAHP